MMNRIDDIPTHGLDIAEHLIKQIDEFTNEIDELVGKGLNEADETYIDQGKYAIRTKSVINSLQNDAYRSTARFHSALEYAAFRIDETTADEKPKATDLTKEEVDCNEAAAISKVIEEDINNGMNGLKCFQSLCDKTDTFCIKLDQVCAGQIKKVEAYRFKSNVSAFVVTEITLVLAIIAVVIGVLLSFDFVLKISIVVMIVLAGIVAYATAKTLLSRKSARVYNDTIASLERTKTTLTSLSKTIDEFRMAQREVVNCADDILLLIDRYKDHRDAAADDDNDRSQMDEYVSTLHGKCQELQKSVAKYKIDVATPIKNLDEIDANFSSSL